MAKSLQLEPVLETEFAHTRLLADDTKNPSKMSGFCKILDITNRSSKNRLLAKSCCKGHGVIHNAQILSNVTRSVTTTDNEHEYVSYDDNQFEQVDEELLSLLVNLVCLIVFSKLLINNGSNFEDALFNLSRLCVQLALSGN